MRKFSVKKAVTVGAAAVIVASGAGVAFAYWTSTGTGTGSATTGTSSAFAVTTDAGTPAKTLTPGGPSETVAIHIKNNNSGHQAVSVVHVTVANTDGSAWTSGNCSAGDFTVLDPTIATPQDVASGATYESSVTVAMRNLTTNQNDCKDITVPLYVAVS